MADITCLSLAHPSPIRDSGLRSLDPGDDADASSIPPDQLENRRQGCHPLLCAVSSRHGFDVFPKSAKLRWHVDLHEKPVYPRVWVCHTRRGRKPIPVVQVRVLCRYRSRSSKFNPGVTVLITCHRYSRSVLKGEYDGGEKRLSLSLIGKSFLITFFLFPATTSRRRH